MRKFIVTKYGVELHYHEGLALVEEKAKYGYVDEDLNFIIEPRFYFAKNFSEGLARVSLHPNKTGYIDKTGKFVIEPRFEHISCQGDFHCGLARICVIDKHDKLMLPHNGYIDKSGTFVIPPIYRFADDFSYGLAAVQISTLELFGYIDTSGKYVLEPQFEVAASFIDGKAYVKLKGIQHIIDTKGKILRSGKDCISYYEDLYDSEDFY